jgi:hypothetical protein
MPSGPKRTRVIIVTPKGKPGRPRFKPCASPGCGHTVANGSRFCPKHCAAILSALRASSEYRTDDLSRGIQQIVPAYERTRASEL